MQPAPERTIPASGQDFCASPAQTAKGPQSLVSERLLRISGAVLEEVMHDLRKLSEWPTKGARGASALPAGLRTITEGRSISGPGARSIASLMASCRATPGSIMASIWPDRHFSHNNLKQSYIAFVEIISWRELSLLKRFSYAFRHEPYWRRHHVRDVGWLRFMKVTEYPADIVISLLKLLFRAAKQGWAASSIWRKFWRQVDVD